MTLDEHLQRMRAEGTAAAERGLWRAVHDELWRCYRSEANFAVKQDLVSRTFVVIVAKLPKFKPDGPDGFTRYVRKIAGIERSSHEREVIRAAERQQQLREWDEVLRRTSPLTWLLRQVHYAISKRLIARLATPQREALQYEDAQALASARGIGLRAARMCRRRAMEQLADLWDSMPTPRP